MARLIILTGLKQNPAEIIENLIYVSLGRISKVILVSFSNAAQKVMRLPRKHYKVILYFFVRAPSGLYLFRFGRHRKLKSNFRTKATKLTGEK